MNSKNIPKPEQKLIIAKNNPFVLSTKLNFREQYIFFSSISPFYQKIKYLNQDLNELTINELENFKTITFLAKDFKIAWNLHKKYSIQTKIKPFLIKLNQKSLFSYQEINEKGHKITTIGNVFSIFKYNNDITEFKITFTTPFLNLVLNHFHFKDKQPSFDSLTKLQLSSFKSSYTFHFFFHLISKKPFKNNEPISLKLSLKYLKEKVFLINLKKYQQTKDFIIYVLDPTIKDLLDLKIFKITYNWDYQRSVKGERGIFEFQVFRFSQPTFTQTKPPTLSPQKQPLTSTTTPPTPIKETIKNPLTLEKIDEGIEWDTEKLTPKPEQQNTEKLTPYRIKNQTKTNPDQPPQEQNRNLCLRCGGNIIKKSGEFGEFFACSNYPQCKYKPPKYQGFIEGKKILKPITSKTQLKCKQCFKPYPYHKIVENNGFCFDCFTFSKD